MNVFEYEIKDRALIGKLKKKDCLFSVSNEEIQSNWL